MTVWVDGHDVRGYKSEQFEDAFRRLVVSEASVGVRATEPAPQADSHLTEPDALTLSDSEGVRLNPLSMRNLTLLTLLTHRTPRSRL